MTAIPIRELSHHTARCLALVKAGESVDITERGTVIGRIIPVDPQRDVRVRLLAEGRMRPATRSRAAMIAEVSRRVKSTPDVDNRVSDALQDMRESERY
jgi:antitoxin (DNA-binding transcriptional repressor) of toxin-antitoxin stability system